MKTIFASLLLICIGLTGCKKIDSKQHIKVDKPSMNIILGTTSYLNVNYNVNLTHIIDNWDVATLIDSEKHGEGNLTLELKGNKLGDTQIHLKEGVTNKFEVVVDIHCTYISGIWTEWCDALSPDQRIQISVQVDDPILKTKIEQEILNEASERLQAYYKFSVEDMTFTITDRNGVSFEGRYEQENNSITLYYEDTIEKFWLSNSSLCYFMNFDYTDKYKKLYPDNLIHSISCRRCLTIPIAQ